MLEKVISGDQTGADRIGLYVAKQVGFETGGWAPRLYKTERGYEREVLKEFGLIECESSNYNVRTVLNVAEADGTVLFGDMTSPGSIVTLKAAKDSRRPYISNPGTDRLYHFIISNNIKILNVAGNRGSKLNSIQKKNIGLVLLTVFKELKNGQCNRECLLFPQAE